MSFSKIFQEKKSPLPPYSTADQGGICKYPNGVEYYEVWLVVTFNCESSIPYIEFVTMQSTSNELHFKDNHRFSIGILSAVGDNYIEAEKSLIELCHRYRQFHCALPWIEPALIVKQGYEYLRILEAKNKQVNDFIKTLHVLES